MEIIFEDYTKIIKNSMILNKVSITFHSGMIYGLKGRNGSGKTMLMRAVCGLIYATSGKVSIDGKVIGKDISFPDSLGVLIENPAFLPGYTGFQNLKNLADLRGVIGYEEIRQAISDVGLDPDDKRKYRKYSLGMKQRLGIAAAIMEHPDIIVLDEPTNALDESGIELLQPLLERERNRGALILLSCHDTDDLNRLADQIVIVKEGCVYLEAQ
jgi:ABC-2 type transport system ATP-binding protein